MKVAGAMQKRTRTVTAASLLAARAARCSQGQTQTVVRAESIPMTSPSSRCAVRGLRQHSRRQQCSQAQHSQPQQPSQEQATDSPGQQQPEDTPTKQPSQEQATDTPGQQQPEDAPTKQPSPMHTAVQKSLHWLRQKASLGILAFAAALKSLCALSKSLVTALARRIAPPLQRVYAAARRPAAAALRRMRGPARALLARIMHLLTDQTRSWLIAARQCAANVAVLYALVMLSAVPAWHYSLHHLNPVEAQQLMMAGGWAVLHAPGILSVCHLGVAPIMVAQIAITGLSALTGQGLAWAAFLAPSWRLSQEELGTRRGQGIVRSFVWRLQEYVHFGVLSILCFAACMPDTRRARR